MKNNPIDVAFPVWLTRSNGTTTLVTLDIAKLKNDACSGPVRFIAHLSRGAAALLNSGCTPGHITRPAR
jgi:hypothetical protein